MRIDTTKLDDGLARELLCADALGAFGPHEAIDDARRARRRSRSSQTAKLSPRLRAAIGG